MKLTTPFYPQSWSPRLRGSLGFSSPQEEQYWESRSCGILSLKMAIDGLRTRSGQQSSPTVADYIKKGLELHAYIEPTGWRHSGLAQLAQSQGAHSEILSKTTANMLTTALSQGMYPIVSIKWAFQNSKTFKQHLLFWKKYGGHLALVVGYETANGAVTGFYVHHTSIRPAYNWQYRLIPLHDFLVGFTGRCILIADRPFPSP